MNSSKPNSSGNSSSFHFDFGIPSSSSSSSSSSRSLNGHNKSPSPAPAASYSYSVSSPAQNKPSWTHQPARSTVGTGAGNGLSNSTSMVGDIFGKTWTTAPPTSGNARIGLPESKVNPNLFGDLLGGALGQQKRPGVGVGGNVPLKPAGASLGGSFSVGGMANSLPKSATSTKTASYEAPKGGGFSSTGPAFAAPAPMNKMGSSSYSAPMASAKGGDPFASLTNFGSFQKPVQSKPAFSTNAAAPPPPPPSTTSFPAQSSTSPMNSFSTSPAPNSFSNFDDGFGSFTSPSQPSQQPKSVNSDPLGMVFSSSSSSSSGAAPAAASGARDTVNDWGSLDTGFEDGDAGGGSTTELDGLPPPPAGVTSNSAKDKGMNNYKQGQFADAIKWLSWAIVLFEKSGTSNVEVLSCRASCYKEVGEYKKAIADCTKILDGDRKNVAVLLQRALLYESSEKYKLGAEDLREVLKIDPSNRLANGTIHRLLKMAG